MNRRKILVEIPSNIDESSSDSFSKMKEITKITKRCNKNIENSIRIPQKKEKIEYIPYIPNSSDDYIHNFKKLMRNHKKFLQYFNANSLESVIDMYSDLKCYTIQLEKKLNFLKEEYKSKIKSLQVQNESNQNKIELLEKTINSLHNENEKTILIIEALQNENVVLSEKNVSDNLNNKIYSKTLPITSINSGINNTLLISENNNLRLKCQRQEIDYQNLKIEQQKQENENQNLRSANQSLEIEIQNLKIKIQDILNQNESFQSEINNLKADIIQLNKEKISQIQKIEEDYTSSQKKNNDQLTLLVKKYKKQNELLKLNKDALETENKALTTSLDHQSFLKKAIKNLKRQNFKLEIEVENLKMKNFKSPFLSPNKSNFSDMIDIGIITSFSQNNINPYENIMENTDYQRLYLIEKERRKLLAILLSRLIQMFDDKCNQLLFNFSVLMDSQSARIQNIITAIHEI